MGVNVFDPDGNQIKQTVNNIDGTVAYVMELEYDANGNITKRVNDGIVRAEYAYNENGQKTKQFLYEPDGSIRWGYEITEYTTANLTRAQADFLFDRLLQELMS